MSQHKQQEQCRAAGQSAVARVLGWLRETVTPRPPGHWTLSRDGRLIRERSLGTTEE